MVLQVVSFAQVVDRETLWSRCELQSQVRERPRAPVFGTGEQNRYRLDVLWVLPNEADERGEIIFWLVFLAIRTTHQP